MRRLSVLLLAITLPVTAYSGFGAIQPEAPSAPESQDSSGHKINKLHIAFVDTVIDDIRWPGESGVELLYVGYFGFGVVDNFISSSDYDYYSRWSLEAGFYFDWNWPTEVPWGNVPPRYGDENNLVYMTDADCTVPLGVRLRQHSFGFADWPNEDFIFILWTVYNAEGGNLEDAAAGLYMDVDIGPVNEAYDDWIEYDLTDRFAYMFDEPEGLVLPYFGVTTLGDDPTGSFHGWNIHDGFEYRLDEFYYTLLSQVGRFQELPEFFYDWRFLLGYQLYDLAPGETRDYAMALVAGEDLQDIIANVLAARIKWQELFGGEAEPSIEPRIVLSAPWPCPVQDSARFNVELVEGGYVEVALYDVSGRRVDTLYDGYMAPGRNELKVWSGGLPSGVYLIQAQTEGGSATQRLVITR